MPRSSEAAAPPSPTAPDAPVRLWPVYRWSLSYLRPYLGLLLLVVGTSVLLSAAELAVPKSIEFFVDIVLPADDRRLFWLLGALLTIVLLVVVAASMAQNLLRRHLQEKPTRDIQQAIFRHLRRLGFAYYERHPAGETLSFLNTEVAAMQNFYRQQLPWLIDGLVFSTISVGFMIATSPRLSLIVAPCFLLYYLFGPMLERRASISGKQMARDRVDENRKIYESVSAIQELRASAAEAWDLRRYLQLVRTFNASMIRTYWFAYLRGTNRRLTYNLGAVAIFIYGFALLRDEALSAGQFIAFLLIYFTAMHRLTAVVTNITEQRVLMAQVTRLHQFMSLRPAVSEPAHPIRPTRIAGAVRFERVGFAYDRTAAPILRGFDLSIAAGERVALVGVSGGGKSTALKLLGRFYDPDEGEIRLDGMPLPRLGLGELRGALGYVFQETYIFGSSVRDNIRFGRPEATDEEIERAARAACAHDFVEQLPDGYDTLLGERGVKLSGGQKQRIAIARMLIRDPAIVLLDEATSALDNDSEAQVQQALGTLLRGRTVIAVAHRLSTVRQFDRIAVIAEGRVAELGSHAELADAGGLYSRLLQNEGDKRQAAGSDPADAGRAASSDTAEAACAGRVASIAGAAGTAGTTVAARAAQAAGIASTAGAARAADTAAAASATTPGRAARGGAE
ncbi:ABC transporter ATP-binding protein [Paenibacillus sp. IB182496]|uniref:ABC transporter ATP-binding protein n=1 Tax=Paenibacillus sabuli TaxID=2772509 RepID=A0A927GQH1_9BACL|nr:ABC transporter ATP-binding protein [Paenibacillus sabuli]MBD2843885.1 ABC transporter ATP-binding protein [Paenibacillus sabuli]